MGEVLGDGQRTLSEPKARFVPAITGSQEDWRKKCTVFARPTGHYPKEESAPRHFGWDMAALWERTDFVRTLNWLGHGCSVGFVWTLTWLGHGCSVGTDGLCVDINMVGTWMRGGNGRTLCGP